ncbi:cupin domain-containing protein [Niabella sp. CJ426]|uniref:cupin domain-containing protein n=1 Tax=Niabella sp. CJ426 TaxID=3393740 RepID=UPI003CFF2F56
MKRRNFLTATTLSLPAMALPALGNDVAAKPKTMAKGFFIRANESRFGSEQKVMNNDLLRCVIANSDAGSQVLMGTTMPASLKQKGGPPLHIHKDQEEIFFVVSGEFLIQIGEEVFTAKAGDAAFIPRGTPHTFANPIENNPGTLIAMHVPGTAQMEHYFQNIAKGIFKEEAATDLSVVGPPISLP